MVYMYMLRFVGMRVCYDMYKIRLYACVCVCVGGGGLGCAVLLLLLYEGGWIGLRQMI